MGEFNSQVDVLQALLDGKEIYCECGDLIIRYKIIDNAISFTDNGGETWQTTDHTNFASFYLYNTFNPSVYRYKWNFTIVTNSLLKEDELIIFNDKALDLTNHLPNKAHIIIDNIVLLTEIS